MVRTVRYRLDSPSPRPDANCCKNVTPLTGVRDLASAPERNRRFRIQSVEPCEQVGEWGRSQDHIRFPTLVRSRWLTSGEGPERGTRPWVKHNRNAQPR